MRKRRPAFEPVFAAQPNLCGRLCQQRSKTEDEGEGEDD